MSWRAFLGGFVIIALVIASCAGNREPGADGKRVYKGLYIFGPEMKTFTACKDGMEFWVADSSSSLELAYANMNFEKPYEPVYVEFEASMVESDIERSADFDSTLIVHKVMKITKEIPPGSCVD